MDRGCPFGELNCSPLFWQAVSEKEKNTERIANPKKKSNVVFYAYGYGIMNFMMI